MSMAHLNTCVHVQNDIKKRTKIYLVNLSSLLAYIASNVGSSSGMFTPRLLAFSSNIGKIISKPHSVQLSSSLVNLHIFSEMNDKPTTSQIHAIKMQKDVHYKESKIAYYLR